MPTFSKACVALFILSGAACTVVTKDDKDDAGTGTGSSPTSSSAAASTTTAGGGGATGSSATGSGGAAGTATTGTNTGGSSGAGGSGTGGSAGMDGGVVSDAAVPTDPCNDGGAESTPNEDRDHATVIPLGPGIHACLQSATDIDFYQFTAPASPAQGGYVKIQLTDVGPDANIDMHVFAAHDNGEFEAAHNATLGGSAFLYFAAKAGATYRLKVTQYVTVNKPSPYLLTAAYTPVNDVNEPNDDTAHATPLTVGTAASGYFFAGLEDSTPPADAAWEDRFKVTLPAGAVTITLSNIASDINGEVRLLNPLGSEITNEHDVTLGSSVVLKTTLAAGDAGACVIVVAPYSVHEFSGTGSTVPVSWTQPYSILVTNP